MAKADPEIRTRVPHWWRTAVALSGLFLFDLVVLGQGGIAIIVATVGVGMLVVGGLWAAIRAHRALARSRMTRAGMYVILGVAAVGTLRFHEATARKGAQQIISACQAYKQQTGKLPDRLEDLVPEFLPKVPLARYTLLYNDFWYFSQSGLLTYVVLPPFGRRVYNFNSAQWKYLD